MTLVALLVAIVSTTALVFLFTRHRALQAEHRELTDRMRPVVDADAERSRVLADLEQRRVVAESELARIRDDSRRAEVVAQERQHAADAEQQRLAADITRLKSEAHALDEEANLREFGFYKPHYDFADSPAYQERLDAIHEQQKGMLKAKSAAGCNIEWSVNGSKTEGRKQINQMLRLMLRAFNGEADAAIAKVRYNNVHVMEARIDKSWEMINSLAQVQQCTVVPAYRDLKLAELRLSHEYEEKVAAEKEEQRRIKEQMREEEIALREIQKALEESEREERRFAEALEKARTQVEPLEGGKREAMAAKIAELERRLAEAHEKGVRAKSRAEMTRSGHVYVISNVGSFGEDVFKIGMTRRLEPMDRVRELGDASVPFQFDVHAIIYTDDAPALEYTLHREFDHHRINLVNERKEFFKVPIDRIAEVARKHKADAHFTLLAEAAEFRKTTALIAARHGHGELSETVAAVS
jgi:hypothetical protein